MRKAIESEKIKHFFILILLLNVTECIRAQAQSREAQVCARNKKKLFESEISYGGFAPGAPEMKYQVDRCRHYDPFVTGGSPALPKEFPPMARLGNADGNKPIQWFCGGTLISESYVLTAAHCFYSVFGEVNRVRLGDLDFSRDDDNASPEDFVVKRTINHPDYKDELLYNDIGLIELERKVKYDSYKHPACLPINDGNNFDEVIVAGWGNTRFAGLPSEQLLKAKLKRFDDNTCGQWAQSIGERLNSGLHESQICAGSSYDKDTCNGDSGGPLLAYHEKFPCMYYVVGITSAGIENCGRPNVPGIYTRVSYYIKWINSYINA